MRIALYISFLFATSVFLACAKTPATNSEIRAANVAASNTSEPKKSRVDPTIVEFLLTSAATDFQEHPPGGDLAHFRNVRIGHVPDKDGKPQYRICGEFSRVGHETDGEWEGFATLKTSGYEQYIGSLPLSYCEDKSLVWDDAGDLSSQLQSKFDSLPKGKK